MQRYGEFLVQANPFSESPQSFSKQDFNKKFGICVKNHYPEQARRYSRKNSKIIWYFARLFVSLSMLEDRLYKTEGRFLRYIKRTVPLISGDSPLSLSQLVHTPAVCAFPSALLKPQSVSALRPWFTPRGFPLLPRVLWVRLPCRVPIHQHSFAL